MSTAHFDRLSRILFDGPVTVSHLHVELGTKIDATREERSEALLASMTRVGIIADDVLVNPVAARIVQQHLQGC